MSERALPLRLASAAVMLIGMPAAAGSLAMQIFFDGVFVPGAPAELGAEVLSDLGGMARVTVSSERFRLSREVLIEAETPVRLALPVRPARNGRVEIEAELPDGSRPAQTLVMTAADRPVAIDAAGPLPETPSGYGPVERLRIGTDRLTTLSQVEVAALAAYLAGCGSLVVPDAGLQTLTDLRKAAGCAGRRVSAEPAATPAPAPIPRPTLSGLDTIGRLWLLLLPYPLLVAALAGLRHPGPWLLLVPLAATLFISAALPQAASRVRAETLAVMEAGDPAYRWRALLIAAGTGRPTAPLPLPTGSLLPRALDDQGIELVQRPTHAQPALILPVRLLQQRRYELTGSASDLPITGALPGGDARLIGNTRLVVDETLPR